MEIQVGPSLPDLVGGFHLSVAGVLVLCVVVLTVFQLRSERLARRTPLLLLGVAIYLWGRIASGAGETTFRAMRSHGGGFDPSMTEFSLASIAAIEVFYSAVALLAVFLSVILAITRTQAPNKPSHSSPDRAESK